MLETFVLVLALAGLAAVVTEIVVKDPHALAEIVTDVRKMAAPAGSVARAEGAPIVELKKAA